MRKHELLERQQARRAAATPSAASRPSAGAHAAAARRALRVFQSPGPIYEPEGSARRLLAHGARALRRRLSRRRPGAQQLQLPPDPGRLDDGDRRACARLHGVSRRRRATPSCRCRRWPSCAPDALCRHAELPAASCSRRPPRSGVPLPSLTQGARSAARRSRRRCATGSAERGIAGLPELRHGRPRPDRLRDRGARGPGARRRRDRRDRAPRHRRPGARRRGRRGRRDDAEPRLPADPLRHRRPVGGAARAAARPAAPTRASSGWLGRADQTAKVRGMFVHPGQVAEIARAPSRGAARRGWWSSGEMADDRMTLHVEVAGAPPKAWPSASPQTCAT